RYMTLASLSALALACSAPSGRPTDESSSGLDSLSTESSDTNTSAPGDGDGDGDGDATGGQPCTMDSECPGGQVCLPGSGECGPVGSCLVPEDCPDGQTCVEGMCMIGGDCGGFVFSIEAVPPNLLIMLDRRGSME